MDHDHHTDRPGTQSPAVLPHPCLTLSGALALSECQKYIDAGNQGNHTFDRIRILDNDIEHLAEILAQTVGRRSLNATSRGGDKAFDCRGVQTTCTKSKECQNAWVKELGPQRRTGELLLLTLHTRSDWNSEQFLIHAPVQVEDL